jgi:hypothetical protein
MKAVQFKLHPHWQRDTGHCQITYVSKNDRGQRLIYCLQDNGKAFGGIRLMRCTQEHEPSHEVKFTQIKAIFEKPKGDSELEKLACIWIDKYEIDERNKK